MMMGGRKNDALDDFAEEFSMDPYDMDAIKSRITDEKIPALALDMALADIRQMKKKGQEVRSPQGLLTHLLRKHSKDPEAARSGSNPMSGDGYDFWRGDRHESEKICQQIVWGFESDDDGERQEALRLLANCAPVLDDGELTKVMELSSSFDGTYAMRLAEAVRSVAR